MLYSLPIKHNFTVYGHHFGSGDDASNDYYLHPTGPWNFALEIDLTNPAKTLTFDAGAPLVVGAAPFNRSGPLTIKARARAIPGWVLDQNSAAPPPLSPACGAAGRCSATTTEVTLVPHGYTELRIGEFPLA